MKQMQYALRHSPSLWDSVRNYLALLGFLSLGAEERIPEEDRDPPIRNKGFTQPAEITEDCNVDTNPPARSKTFEERRLEKLIWPKFDPSKEILVVPADFYVSPHLRVAYDLLLNNGKLLVIEGIYGFARVG